MAWSGECTKAERRVKEPSMMVGFWDNLHYRVMRLYTFLAGCMGGVGGLSHELSFFIPLG